MTCIVYLYAHEPFDVTVLHCDGSPAVDLLDEYGRDWDDWPTHSDLAPVDDAGLWAWEGEITADGDMDEGSIARLSPEQLEFLNCWQTAPDSRPRHGLHPGRV